MNVHRKTAWRLKILLLFLLLMALAPIASVTAKEKYVYCSNTAATLNGLSIRTFAIDGKTAIKVNDLKFYGFHVKASEDRKAIYVTAGSADNVSPEKISKLEKGAPGSIAGKIVKPDIRTFVNGQPITSFTVVGEIYLLLEDLGDQKGSPYKEKGFSRYFMSLQWDERKKLYALTTLISNDPPKQQEKAYEEHMLGIQRIPYWYEIKRWDTPLATVLQGYVGGRFDNLYAVFRDGVVLDLYNESQKGFSYVGEIRVDNLSLSADESVFYYDWLYYKPLSYEERRKTPYADQGDRCRRSFKVELATKKIWISDEIIEKKSEDDYE